MPNQAKTPTVQLQLILDALQSSLLHASQGALQKELAESGVDPLKSKEVMKFAGEKAVNDHYKDLRDNLLKQRAAIINEVMVTTVFLPPTRHEKIWLLLRIFSNHPSAFEPLTAQFREFKDSDALSDAEISSMLKDLIALGYAKDLRGNEGW